MLNVLYDFLIAPTRTSIIQYCFTRALRRWPSVNSAMPQKEARTHSYKGKLQQSSDHFGEIVKQPELGWMLGLSLMNLLEMYHLMFGHNLLKLF